MKLDKILDENFKIIGVLTFIVSYNRRKNIKFLGFYPEQYNF